MLGLSQVNYSAVMQSHSKPSIEEQPTKLEKTAQGTSRLMKYRKSNDDSTSRTPTETLPPNVSVIPARQDAKPANTQKDQIKSAEDLVIHKNEPRHLKQTQSSALRDKRLEKGKEIVQENQLETEAAAKVKAYQSDISKNYFRIQITPLGPRCVKLNQNLTPEELKKLKDDGELISKENGVFVIYGNKGDLPSHILDESGQKCAVKRATAKQETALNELLKQYTKYHAEYHAELHAEESKREKKDERNDYAVIQNGRSNASLMPQTVATEVKEKVVNKADSNLNTVLTAAADLAKERKEDAIEKKREMNAAHAREIHEWQEYKSILKRHGQAPDSPHLRLHAINTVKVS